MNTAIPPMIDKHTLYNHHYHTSRHGAIYEELEILPPSAEKEIAESIGLDPSYDEDLSGYESDRVRSSHLYFGRTHSHHYQDYVVDRRYNVKAASRNKIKENWRVESMINNAYNDDSNDNNTNNNCNNFDLNTNTNTNVNNCNNFIIKPIQAIMQSTKCVDANTQQQERMAKNYIMCQSFGCWWDMKVPVAANIAILSQCMEPFDDITITFNDFTSAILQFICNMVKFNKHKSEKTNFCISSS